MTQKIIIPLGIKAGRLEAEKIVRERGGRLPSNVLLDSYLYRSYKEIQAIFPAWAREVLVYPARGTTFCKGIDIVDFAKSWVLPASYVPSEACDLTRMQLFVDPADFEESKGKVIVIPKSVTIIRSAVENGESGVFDKRTGIPRLSIMPTFSERAQVTRGMDPDFYEGLEGISGFIQKSDGIGVRPLVRDGWGDRRNVFAVYGADDVFGVAVEAPDSEAPQPAEGQKLKRSG